MEQQEAILQKVRVINRKMRGEGQFVQLSLKRETVAQIKKLLFGIHNEISPTSVARGPTTTMDNNDDAYDEMIDLAMSYFMTHVIRLTMMHMGFVNSLRFCDVDIKFAMEQFAKIEERESQIQDDPDYESNNDDDDMNENDDEWQPDNHSDEDNEEMYEHDEEEEINESQDDELLEWPSRPNNYATPIFDANFPHLTESNNFFKLSDREFVQLAEIVMNERSRSHIPFEEDSLKILKDAMFRYLMIECQL